MPGTAANIDEFRSIFGPQCRVKWAQEGGVEVGRRGEEGVVAVVLVQLKHE